MNEKPQKRLVGWKQYVGNIAARVLGRSVAGAFFMGGLACFGLSILTFILWLGKSDINAKTIDDPRYLWFGGLLGVLFLFGLWSAKVLFKRVEKIESVGLITRYNTGNLPEVETLVRGADQPDLDHQAELLRAGEESRKDV
jgi:hypothetical protein